MPAWVLPPRKSEFAILLVVSLLLAFEASGSTGAATCATQDSVRSSAPVSLTDRLSIVQDSLEVHCLDCHQGAGAEAGFDIEQLDRQLDDAETMRRWVQIFDRIDSGAMPPPDHSSIEPEDRTVLLSRLSLALTEFDREHREVVLRRLNRVEYENTVRDLFHIHVDVRDILPADTSLDGFDNVGEGLALSTEATLAYLQAADRVLEAVFGPAQEPNRISLKTNLLDQKTHDGKPLLANQIGKMFRKTDRGLVIFQSNYCPTNLVNFARLAPSAGTYRVTIEARAIQSDRPVTLRVYAGDTIVGRREKHLVGYFEIPPDEWTTIEFEDRLVEPRGTFQPKCYGTRDTRKDANTYPEPGIELGDISIEGPLEPWPPHSRHELLGDIDVSEATAADIRTILARLLPDAYRRPVQPDDIEPYAALADSALAEGRTFEDALRLSLKAVLCSPRFLFLDEPGQHTIDDYALAARLSYFLWSSMPDEQLQDLASQDRLADPDILHEQVERMLDDPRASRLTENFLGQWLDLRDIDFTSPDQQLYPEFDELLRVSMLDETRQFFDELLREDLDVMNLVDSDFAFLNERLAKHYEVPGVTGHSIRKVTLPETSVRGGILTQAAILKVTANGTTTSPVIRGAWVLQNLLGQSVPPPPSGVAAVEPDIRGAITLREQLAKHRDADSCNVCHQHIDPPGFALENFDAIGGWRERYRTLGEGDRPEIRQHPITFAWVRYRLGRPVDASGQSASGEGFEDIREFKSILAAERKTITANLVRTMMVYGTGRRSGFADRQEIDSITEHVMNHGNGMKTLLHAVVQSSLFRRP